MQLFLIQILLYSDSLQLYFPFLLFSFAVYLFHSLNHPAMISWGGPPSLSETNSYFTCFNFDVFIEYSLLAFDNSVSSSNILFSNVVFIELY